MPPKSIANSAVPYGRPRNAGHRGVRGNRWPLTDRSADIQEFVGQGSALPSPSVTAKHSLPAAWRGSGNAATTNGKPTPRQTLPTTIDETHTGVVRRNSSPHPPSSLLGTHSHTSTTWTLALTPASPRLTARLLIMPAEPRAAGPRRPRHE